MCEIFRACPIVCDGSVNIFSKFKHYCMHERKNAQSAATTWGKLGLTGIREIANKDIWLEHHVGFFSGLKSAACQHLASVSLTATVWAGPKNLSYQGMKSGFQKSQCGCFKPKPYKNSNHAHVKEIKFTQTNSVFPCCFEWFQTGRIKLNEHLSMMPSLHNGHAC